MTRTVPALVALLSVLAWCGPAPAKGWVEPTEAEKEALRSVDLGKLTRAREQAEKILEDNETSIFGLWTMVQVFYVHEANHPRALFLCRKARTALEKSYGERPTDSEAQRWHKRLLLEQSYILGEMDRRQEQLDLLIYYDELYRPSVEVQRIWPLMKLGRFDEARAIGRKHIYSDDLNERLRAYNGLMAIADEVRNRRDGYKWGKEGLTKTQEKSCVVAANLSRAALQNFLFEEAEEYVATAKKAEQQDCSSNPLILLASLYLMQGEFQKCVSAFSELGKEPFSQRMRAQFAMHKKGRLAELLYALGQFEEAEKRVREIVEAPDRVGMTSASKENVELANTVLFLAVLSARQEQERERATSRDWREAMQIRLGAARLRAQQWEKTRMALRLGTMQDLLVTAVRPYYLDVMPWYAGALMEILGPGVVHKAVREARALEKDLEPKVSGYFDALDAEAAWRSGDLDETLELGTRALAGLPKKARLVRWRVLALLADVAPPEGNSKAMKSHFHEVIHKYPTALRHLGIALPVELTHRGGSRAAEVFGKLESSPRLSVGVQSGFVVTVSEETSGKVGLCLSGEGAFQYACVHEEELEEERREGAPELTDEAKIHALCDAFHDRIFAPKVELTQSDINTLDGRTGRIGADKALKEILGEGAF